MAKKKSVNKSLSKSDSGRPYKGNIYLSTTIFAIIGTVVYYFIAKLLYSSYPLTAANMIIFFVVVWVLYFFLVRRVYRKSY